MLRSPGLTCVTGSLCIALIGGCATTPYVEPNYPRPGLAREKTEGGALDVVRDRDEQPITRHVTVAQAREYARALQDAYRAAAASESQHRRAADLGIIGSATTAVGVAATGGNAKTAGVLGISAAGLSMLTDRYLDATRRKIYFQGALALECVIGAAVSNPTFNVEAIGVTSTLLETHQFAEDLGDAIDEAQRTLEKSPESSEPECSSAEGMVSKAVEKAKLELGRGEVVTRGAGELLDALDPLGQILLSKIEEIRIRVDAEVAKREPDLLDYNEALKKVLASTPSSLVVDQVKPMVTDPSDLPPAFQFQPFDDHGASESCPNLVAAHDSMVDKSKLLRESVVLLLQHLSAVGREPKSTSLNLFDRCALTDSIGIGPLRLSESAVELPAGTEARVHLRVSGGTPPYSFDRKTLDSGVTVKITAIAADGATLIIHVPQGNASDRLVLPVSDSTGNTRNLVITFKEPPATES